ncbi:RNA 2',3'-cyclic phosphodiesterase [Branchiibius cervicis]|uniref:RNA 2',3'-cyclic phosphodiesterase n=1 Tax=Branchiibius cervicis TaxID=908252 RepID=A0ABW2AP42_9MICO
MGHRMFVAITPPSEVIESLSDFLEPRREHGLPFIDPAQWHVTLAFMGEVPDHTVDELQERLSGAAARRAPMRLRLHGGGTFPDATRAKVLWLGLTGDTDELAKLAVNVRSAANAAGAPVDGKPFTAHLTLSRLHHPIEATRWLRILDSYDGPSWQADRVDLIASHLHEGRRPRYEVINSFDLGEHASYSA